MTLIEITCTLPTTILDETSPFGTTFCKRFNDKKHSLFTLGATLGGGDGKTQLFRFSSVENMLSKHLT